MRPQKIEAMKLDDKKKPENKKETKIQKIKPES